MDWALIAILVTFAFWIVDHYGFLSRELSRFSVISGLYIANWKEVERGASKIAHYVSRDQNFHPQVVVGIGRGGAAFYGLVARKLGLPLCIINKRYKEDEGIEIDVSIASYNLEGRSVLLLEAFSRGGKTGSIAKNYIDSLNPKKLKIGILYRRKTSRLPAEYVAYDNIRHAYIPPWLEADEERLT